MSDPPKPVLLLDIPAISDEELSQYFAQILDRCLPMLERAGVELRDDAHEDAATKVIGGAWAEGFNTGATVVIARVVVVLEQAGFKVDLGPMAPVQVDLDDIDLS